MRFPSWSIVLAATVFAIPFGWGLGVVAALAIAGRNVGQLPAMTVPIGIVAALVFALWPSIRPATRFKVTFIGTVAFVVLARVLG